MHSTAPSRALTLAGMRGVARQGMRSSQQLTVTSPTLLHTGRAVLLNVLASNTLRVPLPLMCTVKLLILLHAAAEL